MMFRASLWIFHIFLYVYPRVTNPTARVYEKMEPDLRCGNHRLHVNFQAVWLDVCAACSAASQDWCEMAATSMQMAATSPHGMVDMFFVTPEKIELCKILPK
jgi:hypothetical protein